MQQSVNGETVAQTVIEQIYEMTTAARSPVKCRIPQRCTPAGGYRPPSVPPSRPKSANRAQEDGNTRTTNQPQMPRSAKPDRRKWTPTAKKGPVTKKPGNELIQTNKVATPVITVPLVRKVPVQSNYYNSNTKPSGLPDQETIRKHEELELKKSDISDASSLLNDEQESLLSKSETATQLKSNWQENMSRYEKMKKELNDKQRAILQLYANMQNTHQRMRALGHKATMPTAEDLRLMNVANMSPEQLLQLCENTNNTHAQKTDNMRFSVDMNKLYAIPLNLVGTCERTLEKRKEIIDWLASLLKLKEKGIGTRSILRKVEEFTAENEMLYNTLEKVKADFLKDMNEIIECLRDGVSETMVFQMRVEELTYELSELNSQKTDLQKQLQLAESLKSQGNKHKIEELEKELKEEKCKRNIIKERLTRADGQVKMSTEQAKQLEAALEQSRKQVYSLERTVQDLHLQNEKLQAEFDSELEKLTESIKENTIRLEEIANSRQKLQSEKEELEKHLQELSEHYDKSLGNMSAEMRSNVAKLIEAEKKCSDEIEERKRLEIKVEALSAQITESELKQKDFEKIRQDNEANLIELKNVKKELYDTKRELQKSKSEAQKYRSEILVHSEAMKDIQNNIKENLRREENLRNDLNTKEEYISELEKKQALLEQQLLESESKMESYETQLSSLKDHITQLQEDFGEFENLAELHQMVNQQRSKLLDATRQNGELAEELQKKDIELEQHIENLKAQDQIMEQKDVIIKKLSEKEDEQANIIELLRNNLEIRANMDNDLDQKLIDKQEEIESLLEYVEKRKQQITQLEQIVDTLEKQTKILSQQRKSDLAKIDSLEKKIAEYESYYIEVQQKMDMPVDHLDNIIKALEEELKSPFEPCILNKNLNHEGPHKKHSGDYGKNNNYIQNYERNLNNKNLSQTEINEHQNKPTKIVMGNFVKKTYLSTNDDVSGAKHDRCDSNNWPTLPAAVPNAYSKSPTMTNSHKKSFIYKQYFGDIGKKQSRMFKIAGHRI